MFFLSKLPTFGGLRCAAEELPPIEISAEWSKRATRLHAEADEALVEGDPRRADRLTWRALLLAHVCGLAVAR